MASWFDDCTTVSEVKDRYRMLCMQHHPDRGGNVRVMQDINAAFETAFKNAKSRQNDAHFAQKASGYVYSDETRSEYIPYCSESPERFRAIITALCRLNVTVELCGSWIWISGDTKPVKNELKAAGCKWHTGKKVWYWREPWNRCTSANGNTPMDDIRATYGSRKYRRDDEGLARA